MGGSRLLLAQTHDNVDARDPAGLWWLGQRVDDGLAKRNIEQCLLALDEEMVVFRDVRVEVRLGSVNCYLAQ